MRKAFFFLGACVVLIGCGSADPADSEDATDAGKEASTTVDSASPGDTSVNDATASGDAAPGDATAPGDAASGDAAPSDAVIFPVEDVGPPGACGIPAGTTATASATGGSNVPSNAIDGKVTTYWGSGGTGGTLRLAFPKTVRFDRARILVRSVLGTPTATFSFTGRVSMKGGTLLGTTKGTATTAGVWLADAVLTPGAWDGLDIAMTAGSPCLVAEVFVYDSTSGCTPP